MSTRHSHQAHQPPEPHRAAGLRRERTLASPQFSDGRFHNPPSFDPRSMRPTLGTMWEFFTRRGRRVPRGELPLVDPQPTWRRSPERDLRATWLGHSTVLLELDGLRILTDPVFGSRVSPLSFMGPKRFHPVPVALDALPDLDLVLLSHDHYDHLCASTLEHLATRQVPIVTALGVGRHLERLGWRPDLITELDWHESFSLRGVQITATPAQHFSGRGLTDRNKTLWASWVIASADHRIFFSGDSGLTPSFVDIGDRYGPFDLVMLEVGAFHPSWGGIHMGPENALKAHAMLRGELLLPVHWGTFNLALHDWDEPAETLLTAAAVTAQRIATPRIGEPFVPSRVESPSPWWRGVETGVIAAATAQVSS